MADSHSQGIPQHPDWQAGNDDVLHAIQNELDVLEHYNRTIQKYGEHKDATEILIKCLCKLEQVTVNISLLKVGWCMLSLDGLDIYLLINFRRLALAVV
jgi:hypothetical protein